MIDQDNGGLSVFRAQRVRGGYADYAGTDYRDLGVSNRGQRGKPAR